MLAGWHPDEARRFFSGCDMKVAFNCNNRNYTLRPWQAHLMEEGLLLSNDFNDSISFECSFGSLSEINFIARVARAMIDV